MIVNTQRHSIMKKIILLTLVGLMQTFMSFNAYPAATKLTLSSWLPPSHPIVKSMIVPWANQVKKATDGEVDIQILAKALGHPKTHYDIARNGLADITYSVHGYTPGRFVMTKISEFPFSGDSAEALSVAYWRVHQKHLAMAKEHRDVQLLSLFTHGPGLIHNSKKTIKTVDDMQGLKFRLGGGVVNDVAKSLQVVSLLKPASKNYELLSHGVADGTFLPMETVKAFKIQDLVPYTTIFPGGLYNVSFFLAMNQDRFAGLSKKNQKAIMDVSGEAFAKLAGQVWDDADAIAKIFLEGNGNTLHLADDAFIADVKDRTAHIETEWVQEANEKGVDGAAALQELRAIVETYNR